MDIHKIKETIEIISCTKVIVTHGKKEGHLMMSKGIK